jgi:capsule polysaccharide modification protein KpsS
MICKKAGLIDSSHSIRLGLAAGKTYQKSESSIREYLNSQNMFFWGPSEIKSRIQALAIKDYENDPTVIAAKILLRN